MTSIRSTIARNTSTVVFVVVAMLCTIGFLLLRSFQVQAFEDAIENDLRVVANGVKVWTDGGIYTELNPSLLTNFAADGSSAFVVRDATGNTVIERSVSLDAANRDLDATAIPTLDQTTWSEDIGPNGAAALVATGLFSAQWGWDLDDTSAEVSEDVRQTEVQITVAHDRTPLDAALLNFALLAVAITIVATAAAGLAVWVSTGLALRPLTALADRTMLIEEPTNAAPFDKDGPKELAPIASRLNSLLARLHTASLAERRFTADAAHELRTPIAELRTLTDVALAFPDDPDRLESVVRTSNELSIRLTSLVDALLGIARNETVKGTLRVEPVDIPALLHRIIDDNKTAIMKRGLDIRYDGPDTHWVDTDTALLTSTLTNLIGNAVAYAPDHAPITISYSGGTHSFRVDLTNPAPNLTQADLDMIFEPFWRKQGSHADRSHSGLGLTLSQNFARLLGLTLHANLLASGDIQITLAKQQTT